MLITEYGMLIDDKLPQLENAISPILVTELGITTDVMT